MAEKASIPDIESARTSGRIEKPLTYLTITVPGGKRKDMCRLLKPFTRSLVCLDGYLRIEDTNSTVRTPDDMTDAVPQYTVLGDEISSPALAVILFLPEFGATCSENVRHHFQKFPWRHHHTIQLQKTGSSSVLGQHEFYFLSRQLPLWSVCTSPHDVSYVRFNLFVRRFNAMVEFYRLITGAEMESRKPGFSLFTIGTMRKSGSAAQPQSSCELALKYSPQVSPYPLTDAYLTFPVHDLHSLLTILPSDAIPISPRDYIVHDPDGNCVILHEVQKLDSNSFEIKQSKLTQPAAVQTHSVDKASVHSDSIDSGRYSDFDTGSSELDQCMTRLAAMCKLDVATAHPRLSNVYEDHDKNNQLHPAKQDMSRSQNPNVDWNHIKKSNPHSDHNPTNPALRLSTHKVNDKTSLHYLTKDHTHHSQYSRKRDTRCSQPVKNKNNVNTRSLVGGQVIPQQRTEPKYVADLCTSFSDNVTGKPIIYTRDCHSHAVSDLYLSKNKSQNTTHECSAKGCEIYPSVKDNSDHLDLSRSNDLDILTTSSTSHPDEQSRTRTQEIVGISPSYKVTFV